MIHIHDLTRHSPHSGKRVSGAAPHPPVTLGAFSGSFACTEHTVAFCFQSDRDPESILPTNQGLVAAGAQARDFVITHSIATHLYQTKYRLSMYFIEISRDDRASTHSNLRDGPLRAPLV